MSWTNIHRDFLSDRRALADAIHEDKWEDCVKYASKMSLALSHNTEPEASTGASVYAEQAQVYATMVEAQERGVRPSLRCLPQGACPDRYRCGSAKG